MTIAVLCLVAAPVGRSASVPAPPRDVNPWWSPAGTTLAFERQSPADAASHVLFTPAVRGPEADVIGEGRPRGFRPGSGELLVETGGTTTVRTADDRQVGSVPGIDAAWSPDGAQIAFVAGDALEVASASGADMRQLVTGVSGVPAWAPDGSAVAVSTAGALEVVPLDGSLPRAVFAGPGADPSWSPDGATIAFDVNQGGRWAIWLVAPDGSGAHEAFADDADNRFPQWSPSGGQLAFLSDRSGRYGLYAGPADGTVRELLESVAPDSPPRWSPDGKALAVAATGDCGRFGITVVAASTVRRSNLCHIDGTSGGDTIYATPYRDFISGFGGNDAIFAGNGDDTVYGGAGNDRIGGGPGNDVIWGGPGNDILSGGTGNDVIHAGPGRDRVGCGPGNDTAYIGPGDTVRDCEHVRRGQELRGTST